MASTWIYGRLRYAEMLEAVQGVRPEKITVALGNGENTVLRTSDYYYYYQALKQAFLQAQADFNAENVPDPSGSKSHGSWSGYAEQLLLERDHLFQVATISRGQIKKLNAAGVCTVDDLLERAPTFVPGINPSVYERLKAQASIQCASRGHEGPLFEILSPNGSDKQGLGLLPPHSALDVFFDIEGFPLDEGGLEYLWGNTYFDEPRNWTLD